MQRLSEPDLSERVHSRWDAAMRAGDFEAAWRETDRIECKRRARGWRIEDGGELLWDGSTFEGKCVLVRCLHGLGDTLQFMRFVPSLAAMALEVSLAVEPALIPLLGEQRRFGKVVNGWAPASWPPHDVEIEVMELPYALRITADRLPGPIPYLDHSAILNASRFVPPAEMIRPRVGLVWRSSAWDRSRSIAPALWNAFQECGAAAFFSLQHEPTSAEMAEFAFPVTSLAEWTQDPLDAARAMLWLDLIITVDSMPAHLAGALNRPVWVLLKQDADWRWMDRRTDSPWYPSMRLFRQASNWADVMSEVAEELKGWCRTSARGRSEARVDSSDKH